MSPKTVGLWLARETRGSMGRLGFFVACLSVGVAGIVSVSGFSAALRDGIRSEGRRLLAADLSVSGRKQLPVQLAEDLRGRPGIETTRLKEMVTMVAAPSSPEAPGASRLAELKVVDGHFPFYGDLVLEPPSPLANLLDAHTAVVAPDLLSRLGLQAGDQLMIGGHSFSIGGIVVSEPDRITDAFTLGPRVFLSSSAFETTSLEQFGSTITYRTLIRMEEGSGAEEAMALAQELEAGLPENERFEVETFSDAMPDLRRGIRRVDRFLSLVALLSLLLGGVGVAQTTRAWISGKTESIAILRCLGFRPNEVLGLYFLQSALLGLTGGLVGVIAGTALQALMPRVLGDLLPGLSPDLVQPGAMLRGLGLGLTVALLFSFGPLLATRRVAPLKVLRKDVEPFPRNRTIPLVTGLMMTGGVVAAATIQSGSLQRGAIFAAGLIVAGLILALSSLAMMRATAFISKRSRKAWIRQAFAALSRPGAATVSSAVALGIGVLLILGLGLVERGLRDELEGTLPADAPSAFLIDIQPDQWPGIETILSDHDSVNIDSVPVVMARLSSIDARTTEQMIEDDPEQRSRRWALTREQRLTYLDELPADNQILRGDLWSDPDLDEVSLEQDFADELGVDLGSVLEFDLQGVPVALTVTSIRSVDWGTFGVNFYLIVEPGVLDLAPQHRIAVARIPVGSEQQIQDQLAAQYPNVTLLNVRTLLEKIAAVVRRLASGVRFLGGFSVLAGIVILAGAVSAESVRRSREIALLKTLGMTRWGVARLLGTQYALIGSIAGVVGMFGGNLLSWAVLTQGWEVAWTLRYAPSLLAVLVSIGLAAVTGVISSWPALQGSPIEVLRSK